MLLVVCAAPAAHARRDLQGDLVKAMRLLSAWRFEEARDLASHLAAEAPDAVETRYVQAEIAFLDGHYTRVIELCKGIPDQAVEGNVGALRALATSSEVATRGFASVRSAGGHFLIQYPPGRDEAIVELTGDVLEAARAALAEDLGYAPPAAVRIEILAAPADLARVSTLTEKDIERTGTIALCKYGKLMVVTPRATLLGYPWMDTMVHEYVHYVVSRMSHDKVPVWLQEGLARYQQVRWRGPATRPLTAVDEYLLSAALKKGDLISFDEMYPSMAKLPSQKAAALAFAEVATMVEFVHDKAGYAGLRKAIALIEQGRSARRAVGEVTGDSWDDVERGWKQSLRAAKLRAAPALAGRAEARRIRFRKGRGEDENVGADEVTSAPARKHARLGGLLRARGLGEAAAVEYEKGLAAAPGDPFIAGKLSRTYLEIKRFDRAIELATPLLTADDSDPTPATTLGLAYQATGRAREAARAFEVALRVSPFDPAVRCGLSEAYGALGDKAHAAREARACQRVRE